MPAARTMDMWQAIQARFDLGNDEKSKRWVYFAISRSWRNWKASLKKKYYRPNHTIREWLQHCPARVNSDQWASLVTFWGSQEGVARSRRNSTNREAQTMSHTAGTKSFARIRDEARARDPNGEVPDRMEVFRMTHTRRDGQLVDRASEDVMGVTSQPQKGLAQPDQQQGASSFTLQLVQRTLEETLTSVQKSIHEDMRNLHIELLRQFHIQETEMSSVLNSVLEKQAELMKEVQALRKEHRQLRQLL